LVLAMTVLVAGAVLALLAIHGLQVYGTFPSPPTAAGRPGAITGERGEVMWLETAGNRTEAWFLPANSPGPAPVLMYTHGNGELIDFWAGEFAPVRAAGIHVLLVEYPGYGRSSGRPSERSITHTLLTAYDAVARDPRVDGARIAGHGRSLGGGAMAQLAALRPLAALVLESSFTSLTDIIRGFGIPKWLVANHFDTRAVLAKFTGPVLVLHGTQDISIPVTHAYALQQAATRATLHVLDCGHNDCPRQWELVLGFLAQNGVCRKSDEEPPHEKNVC
jgi:fermentation-respiration switch protein FrsA (DUF1100 family)